MKRLLLGLQVFAEVFLKSPSCYQVEIEYLELWPPLPVSHFCQAGEVVVCASRVSITCAVHWRQDGGHVTREAKYSGL